MSGNVRHGMGGSSIDMTPEGTKKEIWDKREDDEDRQLDEQKFAPYFAEAIKKIDELESEANAKKIEVVKKLAQDLEEAGFPTEGIANEIVHQLRDKVSAAYIRRNLRDKYKDSRQSTNAKKQIGKMAILVSPTGSEQKSAMDGSTTEPQKATSPSRTDEHVDKFAATEQKEENQDRYSDEDEVAETIAPVAKQNQQTRVGVDRHEITPVEPKPESGDSSIPSPAAATQAQNIPTIKVAKASPQSQPQPLLHQYQPQSQYPQHPQSQSHQPLRILIDWDDLSKKMAELHYKDINDFWLCGRIENDKLLDMKLERS